MSKKKKQSKAYEDEYIAIRCGCGGNEYLIVSFFTEERDKWASYWFTIIQEPANFWERIKGAIELIFRGRTWHNELVIDKKDVKKLRDILTKIIENKI